MRILITCAIAIGTSTCSGRPSDPGLSPGHRTALTDSLVAFSEHMFDVARARDVDAMLTLYGSRADFTHVDNGVLLEWPTLENAIRSTFAQMSENDISWVERPRVMLLNRDTAVIVGRHRFGGGAGIPAHDGMWTGVLQRTEGSWKVVHSHSSDAPEP